MLSDVRAARRGGKYSPARDESLISQNTHSVSAGKSAGTVARHVSAIRQKPQIARHRILLKVLHPLAHRSQAPARARSPAPSVSPSGFTCETITNAGRARSSATTSSVVAAARPRSEPSRTSLASPSMRASVLAQRDRPFGRPILDERQLRRVPQLRPHAPIRRAKTPPPLCSASIVCRATCRSPMIETNTFAVLQIRA